MASVVVPRAELKKRVSDLSLQIIDSIATAIAEHDLVDDIRAMLTDSIGFKEELRSWQDEATELNIIQYAVVHQHADAVVFLSHWDDQLEAMTCKKQLNGPLHLACYVGSLAIIKYYLEDARQLITINSRSSLSYCREYCHIVIPTLNEKMTPLDIAVKAKQLECGLYLLAPTTVHVMESMTSVFTFYINPEYDPNFSPVHRACFLGNGACLAFILEKRFCDLNIKDSLNNSPIHIASWANSADCLELLIKEGADINAVDGYKNTALHTLMQFHSHPCPNWPELVTILVSNGINVEALNSLGYSALDLAAMNCVNEKGLLAISRDVILSDLHRQLCDCIEFLLENGAKLAREDCGSVSRSLLHELVFEFETYDSEVLKSVYECFETLLVHGADPNVRLFQYSYLGALSHLITRLPDVYNTDKIYAISLLELFLVNGANPDIVGYAEEYPFEHAFSQGLPKPFLQAILDFMSEDMIVKLNIGGSHIKPPFAVCLNGHFSTCEGDLIAYREMADEMMVPQVRSLKHIVKFSLLKKLNRQMKLIKQIPLPLQLRKYLTSCYC